MREVDGVRTTHSATGSLQAETGAQKKGRPGRGSEIAMVSAGSLAGGRREPATAAMGDEGRLPAVVETEGKVRAGDRPVKPGTMGGSCAQARNSK
jgi:hypothetical protein